MVGAAAKDVPVPATLFGCKGMKPPGKTGAITVTMFGSRSCPARLKLIGGVRICASS